MLFVVVTLCVFIMLCYFFVSWFFCCLVASILVFIFVLSIVLFAAFFFSSRRRHTRYIGDWSSDVCSSDLGGHLLLHHRTFEPVDAARVAGVGGARFSRLGARRVPGERVVQRHDRDAGGGHVRSEERRVGKECRTRGSAYH